MDVSAVLEAHKNKFKSTEVKKVIPLDFDLGRLTATDINLVDDKILGGKDSAKLNRYLRQITRDGAQLLVNSIFALPTTTEDEAVIAQLPKPKLVLPREKHVPKPKPMTRWERFAQAKGIQNRKKSRLVYDEATDEYLPRWGYKGVNNKEKDWLIELKDNDDPFEDQYQKRRDEKKGRVAKDQRRQQRNAEEAAAKEKLGVENPRALRKADLQRALAVTKSSTASVGKFDPKLEGEPKIKGVKRKFQSATISSKDEKDTAMKLLNKVTGNKRTDVNARKAMKKLKQ